MEHMMNKWFIGVLLIITLGCSSLVLAQSESSAPQPVKMSLLQAMVLGIVEGVTEYLPVSSTGHLLLTNRLLGMDASATEKEASDAYSICIQFGAILAVLWLYFGRIKTMVLGVCGRNEKGFKLTVNAVVGFLPAALIGFLFEKKIKALLFGMWPIAFSWLVGGILILIVSGWMRKDSHSRFGLEELTWKSALVIGLIQCFAMWPGTSRSLVTILGGVLMGLSLPAAVEFSFILGLITLSAATVYESLKLGGVIVQMYGVTMPLVGMLFAFISAVIAVKWMVGYLNRHPMTVFGWYRIGLSVLVGVSLLAGWF